MLHLEWPRRSARKRITAYYGADRRLPRMGWQVEAAWDAHPLFGARFREVLLNKKQFYKVRISWMSSPFMVVLVL